VDSFLILAVMALWIVAFPAYIGSQMYNKPINHRWITGIVLWIITTGLGGIIYLVSLWLSLRKARRIAAAAA